MKTEIRVNAVIENGISAIDAQAIVLIYSFLLDEFNQSFYNTIRINQIGLELNEFVIKQSRNNIFCNIRFPVLNNYDSQNADEKNIFMLDIIHSALLRIADFDKKFDVNVLERIKNKIVENDFKFEFVYKVFNNKINTALTAKVIVSPFIDRFIFSALIEENGIVKCKKQIFVGVATWYYSSRYFCYGRWQKVDKLIIWGKERNVETHIEVNLCKVEIVNLSKYNNPPYYTLMRADVSVETRKQAEEDWRHSLPPSVAALLSDKRN